MRTAALVVATLLLCGPLSGCSSSGDDDYCTAFEDAAPVFEGLSQGEFSQAGEAFAAFDDLAAQAPDAVADDWEVFNGQVNAFEDALGEAGIDMEELDEISDEVEQQTIPDGLDPDALEDIGVAGQALRTTEFTTALTTIRTHAEDECNLTIDDS